LSFVLASGFATTEGADSSGVEGFAALGAAFGDFFAATFFTTLTDFAFKIFAPAFAPVRFALLGRGLAAVFFGFFMATILATGRLLFESTPGIWEAQRLFDFWTARTRYRHARVCPSMRMTFNRI
jgi:hypothetical protein